MTPFCEHCGEPHCLISFPSFTPKEVMDAYETTTLIATCKKGQAAEKEKFGWCITDIMEVSKVKDPVGAESQ